MSRFLIRDPRELLLRPTRRTVLQGAGALAGSAALGLGTGASMAQENVLNILTWPGHGDPAFVKPFEDAHGVKVVAKEYVGGEPMLALMNQSPPGSFDVVLADAEYIGMLQDGGFIDALDPADYPLADYWPEFQKFPLHWVNDELYSVMIRFGYLGLAYRTDMLSAEDVSSYEALWNEKVKGKVGFFDWYLPTMGCLSLYDGNASPFDIDETAYEKLTETLFSLRPQTSGFYSMADQFAMLTNGTAAVIPGIGDWVVLLLQNEGVPVDAVVPEQGGIQWTESMSIVSSSTKKDLARKFIQYASSPEGQFRSARLPAYWASIPNRKGWEMMNAQAPEDAVKLRHTFDARNVMDEYKEGKIHIRQTPVQQDIETWNDTWSEFKAM
ncbi:spermidine/putrescine ABC transporter substrate-binding protein [Aureimonas altamirensis]|uniref:ABC transporter substrate-binding protein n=1 Tax=Aureimonas altamirensis TaxID=370622 RepID=UPI0020375740|nr:spermidine/putrescine ABC transporter substrate-binding protein [Aureimonas altamirensis]MCM2504142.1 spermidine/putrescine ABC transporter substrate-binding protein [Aureimonas altamirensis]